MASSGGRFDLHAFADDARLERSANAAGTARSRLIHQSLESLALEAFPPFNDVAQIKTCVLARFAQRRALGEQQDGSEPARDSLRKQPGAQKFFHLFSLFRGYWHSCLLHSDNKAQPSIDVTLIYLSPH